MVAAAKRQDASYVNVLLDYPVLGKLHCRAILVVKSKSKKFKICSRSKHFWIPKLRTKLMKSYQIQILQKNLAVIVILVSSFSQPSKRMQTIIIDSLQELHPQKTETIWAVKHGFCGLSDNSQLRSLKAQLRSLEKCFQAVKL